MVLSLLGWAAMLALAFLADTCVAEAKTPLARINSKHVVKLEVAVTTQEIQRGLMGRTALPDNAGMVFLFHPPRRVTFWMYRTLIPLDMIFVRDGRVVKLLENVPPCKSQNPEECPHYPEDQGGITVSEVIEVNGGWAAAHGVKEGHAVVFELP